MSIKVMKAIPSSRKDISLEEAHELLSSFISVNDEVSTPEDYLTPNDIAAGDSEGIISTLTNVCTDIMNTLDPPDEEIQVKVEPDIDFDIIGVDNEVDQIQAQCEAPIQNPPSDADVPDITNNSHENCLTPKQIRKKEKEEKKEAKKRRRENKSEKKEQKAKKKEKKTKITYNSL